MAGTPRHEAVAVSTDVAIIEHALRERPGAFEFFAALRALERAHPQRPRLGHSTRPVDDPVRLRHAPSLAFAPRSIDRYVPAAGDAPGQLYGLFLGLFGPNAPLPLHLSEYAIERRNNAKDSTLTAFADIFHHRLLSLFYRAWADAQPTVHADRPDQDRFRGYLDALVGMASPHLRGRDALPDDARRYFSGRLLPVARNAEGLRGIVEQLFAVPVQVVEFVAEWMRLPDDAHLRLGESPEVAELGCTSVLGADARGAQQRLRLRLGPLGREAFVRFLPGGDALRQLTAAVRSYIGDAVGWDLQLLLKSDEVPTTTLAHDGRLGLDTWLGQRACGIADADDVVLRPSG
ncbi:type VI secretion system baseplate subunit TssG [Lysobacter cavernae]|uniref:Type VI secretion system baseplate subunit TssG n=1 Tax=Lysobacter cavernae TaxID=1685901 RepID=A0ABV7RMK5_9GAMM